jgi:uncharacterized protein (DUF1501 family)
MNIQRRDFLKTSSLASGALGLNILGSLGLPQNLQADGHAGNKKMLFIFQRGGNDGINAVIPRGDNEYNTTNRPTLFLRENQALDLGNGFAQLHPGLEPMMEIFNSKKLNGQEGPGNLAVIHRVGYSGQSRSHFNSQHYWENATPGNKKLDEGMFYRQITKTLDLTDEKNAFVAASLSGSQMVSLRGSKPLPNFRKASEFAFQGSVNQNRKFLGTLPGTDHRWPDGSGVLGLYGGRPNLPRKRYRETVHRTGQLLGSTIQTLQDATKKTYTPANGATYPNGNQGQRLREAAMLFKRTNAKILGLNIGGWDTHTSQGQLYGKHRQLLGKVALAFQAFYRDMQDQWDDIVIVTMTEFGRTSKENGSRGTDHAEAAAMFVAGGGVKGGVYNCDRNSWKNGDIFSTKNGRYLARKTDFRSVFGEIFTDHFGDSKKQLEQVIPTYNEAKGENSKDFKKLGLFA